MNLNSRFFACSVGGVGGPALPDLPELELPEMDNKLTSSRMDNSLPARNKTTGIRIIK